MQFTVKIKEILLREITVEADFRTEALIKADEMYRREEIVLSADDYEETIISVHKKKKGAM